MNSNTRPQPSKKPTGGRPLRKFFSKESLSSLAKNGHSQKASSESAALSNVIVEETLKPVPTRFTPLVESPSELNEKLAWTDKDLVSTPGTPADYFDETPGADPARPPISRFAPGSYFPTFSTVPSAKQSKASLDSLPARAGSPGPLSVGVSKARWDNLRHHVLPASRSASPNPSFTSFSQLPLPAGSATAPRPSRLAQRFGFRHVVADVREAVAAQDDLMRRLSEDIQNACLAARVGDVKRPKPEREATQHAFGSTLHLPFMSNTTLSTSAVNSTNDLSLPSSSKLGIRTPAAPIQPASRLNALTQLQNVIINYASSLMPKESEYKHLPLERDVLSVVLIAFLNQSTGHIAEDERRVSFQIFNTVVQFWKSQQHDSAIERCIWCCKALTMPPSPLRLRLLELLSSIVSAEDTPLTTIPAMQTIVSRLFLLIPHFKGGRHNLYSSHSENSGELRVLEELIGKVVAGHCTQLDMGELEQVYGAGASKDDSEDDLKRAVCIEAMVRCLDFGPLEQKRHVLVAIDEYWTKFNELLAPTPLSSKVHSRKINTYLRAILDILYEAAREETPILNLRDISLICDLLKTRVLPELEAIDRSNQYVPVAQGLAVNVVFNLLSAEVDLRERGDDPDDTFADPKIYESKQLLTDWLEGQSQAWRDSVRKELGDFTMSADWAVVVRVFGNITFILPDSSRKNVIALMIPKLQERLTFDAPMHPNEGLSELLSTLATVCPHIFYKPLFLCAASPKDEVIAHQLAILMWLGYFMPNFWINDAEMVAIALMSDPGGGGSIVVKQKTTEGQVPEWGKARMGQLVIFLEVIGKLRSIRLDLAEAHEVNVALSASLLKANKFAAALETRLAVLIEAKEKSVLLPPMQRVFLAAMFLEIRLLTRTLRTTGWLTRFVNWTVQSTVDPRTASLAPITPEILSEAHGTQERLIAIHDTCRARMKPASQRRSTVLVSPTLSKMNSEATEDSREDLLRSRLKTLQGISEHPLRPFLELLVAMSGALKHEDFVRLGPFIWNDCLELEDQKSVIHACFICMQCAEKAHDQFQDYLMQCLHSDDAVMRKETVKRLGILSSWRYQLLSLNFITDKNFRRPFKLARPPLNFVATDVGGSKFMLDHDSEEDTQGQGPSLPVDLKRRLHEIGWDEEDKPQDQRLQWIRTPMSLLGSSQLYELSASSSFVDDLSDGSPSPTTSPGSSPRKSPSPEGGQLLRRNSSSVGYQGVKRRPVFVQPLTPIFLALAKLTMDKDFIVASSARDLVMDYMREDPALLCRPIMEILSGNIVAIDEAIGSLRAFLHVQKSLPPRLTHHVFNHLAGFLKMLAKGQSLPEPLHNMAYVIGVLSRFAPQVSDMSVRAIRRAKLEIFLFPSGSLYFSDNAPAGPMFPKKPSISADPFEDVNTTMANMTMIRMSQSLLFVDLLRRSPQDVLVVRKSWTPLVLPDVPGLKEEGLIPQRSRVRSIAGSSQNAFKLSLSYSRSHLLFVAQLLRCLTRHLSDRVELVNYLDGVNRILLRHGNDIGIVSHVLIVYMIASTRFRRLMGSGTGFTIFLPVLFKVYCEANGDTGIREAIEYAFHRFYAVHEEAFVYQALQIISRIIGNPSVDGEWVSRNAYHLLYSLKSMPLTEDTAGIRDANKAQEQETALAISADERPQVFLASLRKEGKTTNGKLQSSPSTELFESKRFQPENIIRMLLTVIAHDPGSKRAEHFVRLFRYLSPHLYNASNTARGLLRDGIDALGNIVINKVTAKTKLSDPANATNGETAAEEKSDGFPSEHSSLSCDLHAMRSDFLLLFVSFVKVGGVYKSLTLQRAFDLTKLILKDASPSSAGVESIRLFMDQFAQTFVTREEPKYTVSILKEIAPIVSAYGSVLDLTGLLDSLVRLSCNINFANDVKFSRIVVDQICSSVFDICELAAQENILSTLKYRLTFVKLLARAICLSGTDVMAELEGKDPSANFLYGIVLPLVSCLRTRSEFAMETQWTDNWRQDAHGRAWVRLLAFAMSALENPAGANLRSTRGSIRGSPSFSAEDAGESGTDTPKLSLRRARRRPSGPGSIASSVRLAMAFVILKAVILRGAEDISSLSPGAWSRVGALLRSSLRDGSAFFALRAPPGSAAPSPLASPVASVSFNEMLGRPSDSVGRMRSTSTTSDFRLQAPSADSLSSRPSSPRLAPIRRNSDQPFPFPRFVDYLTWSLLEFLCLRRSPLVIQLRMFMNERLVQLHETLQAINHGSPALGDMRQRRIPRPTSTLYRKSQYVARASSSTVTPEGSPRLGPTDPSISFGGNLSSLSSLSTLASPDLSASTSSPRLVKGKRPIIHLGTSVSPAKSFLSPSFVPQSTSANSGLSSLQPTEDHLGQIETVFDARQTLAATELRSITLVRQTYERIRVVQKCLGYPDLVPPPKALKPVLLNTDRSPGVDFVDTFSGLGLGTTGYASPRASLAFAREVQADPEPEPRAWTKRTAEQMLMAEAEELMNAWQTEAAIVASTTDAGYDDGMTSVRASNEEQETPFNALRVADDFP